MVVASSMNPGWKTISRRSGFASKRPTGGSSSGSDATPPASSPSSWRWPIGWATGPYDIVDVTNLQWTIPRPDGTSAVTQPAGAVGGVPADRLVAQLETARPISPQEAGDAGRLWQHLRSQNAPFRVVTPTGLASAPIDHFDSSILEQAAREWRSSAYVIGSTMAHNCDPYMQVGDVMLLARLVALVEEGKLLADGDPWDMRACRVRLPD